MPGAGRCDLKELGRIDGLINSAYMHGDFASFDESSIEAWQSVMSVTCFGALRMVKAVLPAMKSRMKARSSDVKLDE